MVFLKFSDLIRIVPISSCFCLACPLIFFTESYLSLTWLTGSFAWQTTHSCGWILSCVPEQSIFQPFYNCIAHNVSRFATTIVWYQIASIATLLLWYCLFWCSLQGWELRIIIHSCRNISIVDNMFWGIVPFAMWCVCICCWWPLLRLKANLHSSVYSRFLLLHYQSSVHPCFEFRMQSDSLNWSPRFVWSTDIPVILDVSRHKFS